VTIVVLPAASAAGLFSVAPVRHPQFVTLPMRHPPIPHPSMRHPPNAPSLQSSFPSLSTIPVAPRHSREGGNPGVEGTGPAAWVEHDAEKLDPRLRGDDVLWPSRKWCFVACART